jgi:hypothetical protein
MPGVSAIGANTTIRSYPSATSRFVGERTHASMYRRSPMVIGGQIPGRAWVAVSASSNDTPESRSNTVRSPDPASTAVMTSRCSGQFRASR